MTVESKTKPAATAPTPAPEAAVEQPEKVDTTQLAAEATATEQARIAGILQCDEAEGKTNLAQHLAFKTRMSVDDAKAALAVAETGAQASAPAGILEAAMRGTTQPGISAEAADAGAVQGGSDVGELMGSYRKATGRKPVIH